ncbi:MAG TPA: hypothetical protein DCP51_03285 [Clostridiales bacterium]|nr:MAG: hypothetical protein A2Y40_06425 [Candidatus Margulisbacteria bacterium GWF2_35_9]HAN20689.1 hypothetical protein [Clostridiales bacterium]
MLVYNVLTKDKIDFSDVPKAEINCYKWLKGYEPKAFGQLILIKDKGFALKLTAYEKNPKAIYTEYGQPVYKDSCLEFFVRFNKESPLYLNFEMNSNGAFLASVRSDRKNKTNIHEKTALPEVKSTKQEEFWTVETFFSFDQVNALFGKCDFNKGDVFYGNFYKCGDETEIPHYGMWSPINTENADFHQPVFFGELVIG